MMRFHNFLPLKPSRKLGELQVGGRADDRSGLEHAGVLLVP